MAGKWGRNAATADDLKETKRILEIERGGIRWHCVENRLWKSLWETKKKKRINTVFGECLYYFFSERFAIKCF